MHRGEAQQQVREARRHSGAAGTLLRLEALLPRAHGAGRLVRITAVAASAFATVLLLLMYLRFCQFAPSPLASHAYALNVLLRGLAFTAACGAVVAAAALFTRLARLLGACATLLHRPEAGRGGLDEALLLTPLRPGDYVRGVLALCWRETWQAQAAYCALSTLALTLISLHAGTPAGDNGGAAQVLLAGLAIAPLRFAAGMLATLALALLLTGLGPCWRNGVLAQFAAWPVLALQLIGLGSDPGLRLPLGLGSATDAPGLVIWDAGQYVWCGLLLLIPALLGFAVYRPPKPAASEKYGSRMGVFATCQLLIILLVLWWANYQSDPSVADSAFSYRSLAYNYPWLYLGLINLLWPFQVVSAFNPLLVSNLRVMLSYEGWQFFSSELPLRVLGALGLPLVLILLWWRLAWMACWLRLRGRV